jgi:hypothetical protein
MRQPHARTVARTLLGLTVLLALGALGGCYERVVSARGIGATRYTIEEPYQESGQLDRWIFGDEPSEKQRTRSSGW